VPGLRGRSNNCSARHLQSSAQIHANPQTIVYILSWKQSTRNWNYIFRREQTETRNYSSPSSLNKSQNLDRKHELALVPCVFTSGHPDQQNCTRVLARPASIRLRIEHIRHGRSSIIPATKSQTKIYMLRWKFQYSMQPAICCLRISGSSLFYLTV
jgi:hypothetical protein